jgi:hypothetical protein
MHKGYRCLEPNTDRVYISRDVIFYEQVFPFEDLHENAGAKLRQEILLLPSNLLPSYDGVHGDQVSLSREGNIQQNASMVQEEPVETETEEVLPGVPSATNIDLVPMIGTEVQDDSGTACLNQSPGRHVDAEDSPMQSPT